MVEEKIDNEKVEPLLIKDIAFGVGLSVCGLAYNLNELAQGQPSNTIADFALYCGIAMATICSLVAIHENITTKHKPTASIEQEL